MSDKDLQAQLDAANETIEEMTKAAEAKDAALAAATKENAALREAASKAQAAAEAKQPIPAGPPVLMTPLNPGDISVNIGGIRKYAAKAGEFIMVELNHVTDLLAHGFRHASPAEVAANTKPAKK